MEIHCSNMSPWREEEEPLLTLGKVVTREGPLQHYFYVENDMHPHHTLQHTKLEVPTLNCDP